MIALLLAIAPVSTGLFGVELGVPIEVAMAQFAPVGDTTAAEWSRSAAGDTIMWRCKAENRCFAVPARAAFQVVDGTVASVSLTVDATASPPDRATSKIMSSVEAGAKLGRPAAVAQVVDRRVRYFFRKGATVVWAQDGADAEIKISLDSLDPIGRAEAVASGAKVSLDGLPGAADYSTAHMAIGARDWKAAEAALEKVVANKKAAVALKTQSRLVLAMSIAARVKAAGPPADNAGKAAAKRDLARAVELAPDLASDITQLARSLRL